MSKSPAACKALEPLISCKGGVLLQLFNEVRDLIDTCQSAPLSDPITSHTLQIRYETRPSQSPRLSNIVTPSCCQHRSL